MNNNQWISEPPLYLQETLPPLERILQCLDSGFAPSTASPVLFRAANPAKFALPPIIRCGGRFGPPAGLVSSSLPQPYGLLYAAHNPETAAWEGQLCRHDERRPGTYYLDRSALKCGVIVELRFPRPLRLWNLHGSAVSRLGIFDELLSTDHEWCQWFGYRVYQAMMTLDAKERPDGFIYPSRRHPGHTAVALFSLAVDGMRQDICLQELAFSDFVSMSGMLDDPLCVPPPEETA